MAGENITVGTVPMRLGLKLGEGVKWAALSGMGGDSSADGLDRTERLLSASQDGGLTAFA